MKLLWKQEYAHTLRLDLQGGWYLTVARIDSHELPTALDPVNVAIYDASGETGAEAIAYCDFASLRMADFLLWGLLIDGEGPATIAKFIKCRDSNEVNDLLTLARSLIRDLSLGWPSNELAADPKTVCDKITQIVGDNYNFTEGE